MKVKPMFEPGAWDAPQLRPVTPLKTTHDVIPQLSLLRLNDDSPLPTADVGRPRTPKSSGMQRPLSAGRRPASPRLNLPPPTTLTQLSSDAPLPTPEEGGPRPPSPRAGTPRSKDQQQQQRLSSDDLSSVLKTVSGSRLRMLRPEFSASVGSALDQHKALRSSGSVGGGERSLLRSRSVTSKPQGGEEERGGGKAGALKARTADAEQGEGKQVEAAKVRQDAESAERREQRPRSARPGSASGRRGSEGRARAKEAEGGGGKGESELAQEALALAIDLNGRVEA